MISKIIALELRAQIQFQKGKTEESINLLHQATQFEDQLRVGYGPPVPVKPSHELLADRLFQNKQYIKAYDEYINELKREPNRTLSNMGLKKTIEKIKQNGSSVPKGISPYFNKLMIEDNN